MVTVQSPFHAIASHWTWERYIADYIHLFSIVFLFYYFIKTKKCFGISLKSHIIYATIFACRYLDLFYYSEPMYLVFFKIFYILSSAFIILCMIFPLKASYEKRFDTCWLLAIMFSVYLATLIGGRGSWMVFFWTYSQYLEGFAMLPQYIMIYRCAHSSSKSVFFYVLLLGAYRSFYGLHWLHRYFTQPGYVDITSWVGGVVNVIFFLDFIVFCFKKKSIVSCLVLNMDDGANAVKQQIELAITTPASFASEEFAVTASYSSQPGHRYGGEKEVEDLELLVDGKRSPV
eukprot:GHVL01040777.1.p1 GENE.GHVL01040777.1~~GHVL01040777.1.p1  ORF type:complete len:288 (+),score=25.68 GHVL01040777.1:48-911(+)